MIHRDDEMALLSGVLRGRVGRRDLLRRAAALGLSAPVVSTLLQASSATALAHQGDGTPAAGATCTGSITWALEADPANLIPFGGVSSPNMWGKELMYESLLEWDRDLQIQPALAESYEVNEDATSYTFRLRQGVLFHNGQEMTANDVKYSFDTALSPPAPGIEVAFLGNIASVEAVDDYTVTITMSKPDPTLPGVVAWSRYTPIVPAGIGDQINWLSEGIGTGPYRLVEFVSNDRVVYTCNEDYWKAGVPCIRDVTLKVLPDEQSRVAALRSGEIDGGTLTADVARTLENDESLQILEGLFAAPRVIQFNTTQDVPWRDVRVRQAINLAIDRQEIIDNVYGGSAELSGAIAPGYGDWALPEERLRELYTPNLEQATALMQEAGLQDGFDVTLQAIAAPREYTQIAEIVRERLRPLNINVTVEPLEIGTFATNIGDGTFEWASTGRGMRGDPSGFVVDFRSGTALNVKWFGDGWKNEEIDRLYDEALATADVAQRLAAYHRIQEIIAEDVPNLYTVQPYKFQVANQRVEGMYVSYTDFNPGLRTACVTEG
ncbi:MAG TPA: ABC transporter substrate-binding protein [Thermomicrobiales bacterium]|nr:ABC transporter substrate-binding protein [Thermomicrobiales bacterium]